ncbi:MAG TPA: ribosome silencing factor [Bryobacteraceae bacterium]|nr:ribosome silencing factor [Bryobacteraceae bacterium]
MDGIARSVVRWAQRNAKTSLTNLSFKPNTAAAPHAPESTWAPTTDRSNWAVAAQAAESKKALDLRILDLREVTSFTDFFVICTSSSGRQGQAIADEIGKQLKDMGEKPVSVEGYDPAEWILMDYGDFIVHVFSEAARSYYDLERLWRHAKAVDLPAQAG